MKMFFAVIAFVTLLLGQGSAQDAILPCAAGCVSGVFANAASMGCAMNDILCVCGKSTDFTDGIRDCVNQACPAADVAAQLPLAQSSGTEQCKTASAAATSTPTAAQSQVIPPTQQAAASSPSTTATETPAEATSGTSGTTATSISTSSPVSTPGAETTEAALSVASTDSSATSTTSAVDQSATDSASSTMSATTSGDSGVASDATAAADNSNSGSSSTSDGLSVAARAGIGAGSGVAAVLIAILAFCLITRRRKQKKAAQKSPSMQISQPLPGSGRLYADGTRQADTSLSKTFTPSPQSSNKANQPAPRAPSPVTPPYSPSVASSYASELDMNARRYEDLTPRSYFWRPTAY
ncbi:hypothetical protein F4781DRAFT_432830 [Annulohypoxylon bovei var. microspora]|nr:hypothetical protein F4781DRAFT_432830 [Annulohypoxylon bovei var. microspora]